MSDMRVTTFRSATGISLTVDIPRSVAAKLADPKGPGIYKDSVAEEDTGPDDIDQITINVIPDDNE
ncbi:hypothetical protein ACE1OC_40995 [Streptomyces sp. DSM 116496]|uniref:hypothetical protein n=1 Tax=Streptomyces stoeckheimensis TaxID=3344656 RepID=UPI0038B37D0F